MATYRLTETMSIELIIELPDGISEQERDALLTLWRQAIQVGAEGREGESLLGNPCLKTLIYAPVCSSFRCEAATPGKQGEVDVLCGADLDFTSVTGNKRGLLKDIHTEHSGKSNRSNPVEGGNSE